MESENTISALLTPESKFQRPIATGVKVVLNVWDKDYFNPNKYKPIKQLLFSSVEAAINHKYIHISSDLIEHTKYEIYIDGYFVESGKYKDLKNSVYKNW